MSSVGDVLFELDDLLAAHGVRYVIGGALALAYYAEPRATADVDVCVETAVASDALLLEMFATSGWLPRAGQADLAPVAGVRLEREGEQASVDVFFSFDRYHQDLLDNAVQYPFLNRGERRQLPFVSANDYVVLKLSFSRPKDWVDVQAVLDSGQLVDVGYVERQLTSFRGSTFHPHIARLRRMVEGRSGGNGGNHPS